MESARWVNSPMGLDPWSCCSGFRHFGEVRTFGESKASRRLYAWHGSKAVTGILFGTRRLKRQEGSRQDAPVGGGDRRNSKRSDHSEQLRLGDRDFERVACQIDLGSVERISSLVSCPA